MPELDNEADTDLRRGPWPGEGTSDGEGTSGPWRRRGGGGQRGGRAARDRRRPGAGPDSDLRE